MADCARRNGGVSTTTVPRPSRPLTPRLTVDRGARTPKPTLKVLGLPGGEGSRTPTVSSIPSVAGADVHGAAAVALGEVQRDVRSFQRIVGGAPLADRDGAGAHPDANL